jgi:signal transduction histidine kinase
MFSPQGEYIGHAGSVLDITDRRVAHREIHSLTARLIRAEEEERTRLARELHDDLRQQIAALSIATGNLKRKLPAEFEDGRAQIDRVQNKLINLAESVRQSSRQLHPAILEHSGLPAALKEHCSELSELTGLHLNSVCLGDCQGLSREVAMCLYRVAQEALQNVVKHAQARAADVTLSIMNGTLSLTICDDGVRVPPEHLRVGGGLGLASMRERARLVNGRVEVTGQPNRGTTVSVFIPLTEVEFHAPQTTAPETSRQLPA